MKNRARVLGGGSGRGYSLGPAGGSLDAHPVVAADAETMAGHDDKLHEISASLAGLSSAVGLLARREPEVSEERRTRLLTMLESEVTRLQRLLDGSIAEQARVHRLDELIEPLITARRLTGQTIFSDPSDVTVYCVGDALVETLNNLLVNAAVHAPGAPVTVAVESAPSEVRVLVADGGPGVPPALHDDVFIRGRRGADSPGTGIGLPVARQLISGQGGALRLAAPKPGWGATFALTLPTTSHQETR